MPKRKAVSSPEKEEESPHKTARQKRQEAKARAREWAEREAAGLNKKVTRRTPTKRLSPAKKATPTRKETPASKQSSPIKSPEPAPKRQKLNSGQAVKKLTKKQQIAEAKARAQEWADKQKELDTKKKAPETVAASPSPSATVKTTSTKTTPKTKSPVEKKKDSPEEPPAPAVNQAAAALNGRPYMPPNDLTRAQQEAMARAQMENAWAMQFHQQVAAMGLPPIRSPEEMHLQRVMAYGQPWVPQQEYYNMPPMNAPLPMQSPPGNGGNLRGTGNAPMPANAASYLGSPPPANTLVASRTTQAKTSSPAPAPRAAMVKETKKAVAPVASAPVAASQDLQEEEQDDASVQQDDEEVEGSETKGFRFLPVSLGVLLLPVIVAIGVCFASTHSGKDASVADEQVELRMPPCFISNPFEEDQVFEKCDRAVGEIYCPDGGVCSRGQLKSCVDPFYEVSERRDECVVSGATNETLAKVEALLAEWTVKHTCSLAGCAHAINNPENRAPFFDVALVKEEIDVPESLLSLSDSFVILSGSGESMIGLTDDYLDNRLVVPLWCYFGLLLFSTFEFVVSSFVVIGTWVTAFALNITMTYPLASVACFLTLWAIFAIRNRRRNSKQLRQDVVTARELTYGKLVENVSMEHFVIHLRDEVAMELYPASKSKRAYVINKVWPRVVVDVKHDNRVLKSTKMWQGTPRDAWQWTASTTPGKK